MLSLSKQILVIVALIGTTGVAIADSERHYVESCRRDRRGREVCHREWHSYTNCLQEIWEPLETQVRLGGCTLSSTLARASTTKTYPRMGNRAFNVEYWTGGYSRAITETGGFMKKIYDTCNGRMVSTRRVTERFHSTVEFNIENPNLSDSVRATYDLVPLLQEEAELALQAARNRCEQY